MARVKVLTYEEFMDYAKAHYNKGGDGFYECWEKKQFDDYVEMFGPITKRRALDMFRTDYNIQQDMMGW